MNNKGITLIEMIGVVIIFAIILFIALPSIQGAIEKTKDQKYENIEKILKANMDLYVLDYEDDLFDEKTAGGSTEITYSQLQNVNSDINIAGCTANKLIINRTSTCILTGGCEGDEKLYNHSYSYIACITCTDNGETVYTTNNASCN